MRMAFSLRVLVLSSAVYGLACLTSAVAIASTQAQGTTSSQPAATTTTTTTQAEQLLKEGAGLIQNPGNLPNSTGGISNILGGLLGGSSSGGSSTGGGIFGDAMRGFQEALNQLQRLRDSTIGRAVEAIIRGDNPLSGLLREVFGEMNLIDPNQLNEQLKKDMESNSGRTRIDQANPVQVRNQRAAAGSITNARESAGQILSRENQQRMAKELNQLRQQLAEVGSQVGGSTQLSQQASQLSQQANQLSQQSQKTAQQAQTRVSTQDALKDLNNISANMSAQLGQISTQGAAQAGQLANVSGQLGVMANMEAAQLARLNEVTVGIAAANQNLADVNSLMRGQEQARQMERRGDVNRLTQLNNIGYRLAR